MNRTSAEQVRTLREKHGYGMEQAKRVAEYINIRKDIDEIGTGGDYDDPAYIRSVLKRLLMFTAPDECTGPDCSCHKKTE